jgi:hypothetical protein
MITRSTICALIALLACPLSIQSAVAAEPSLSVSLVDRDEKAMKGWATVVVSVRGIELVDSPTGQLRKGEGHLHYRVDDGIVVATTATKLSFHQLPPGKHRIEVRLVGNDHLGIGPVSTLDLTVTGSSPY